MIPTTSPIEFPEKFECLFAPKRMKVLWGGRGGAKSWGIARALLLIGSQKTIRVLCVREFQKSISESVHKLLSDQIVNLGLERFYEIQKASIIGVNGTTFSFEGIKNNVNKIKSYEGIDYCWAEEAGKISKQSWGVVIPTIRKPGSEIWMSFNPELETDYTYKEFVLHPRDDSVVVKLTWRDNPWFFSTTMPGEMESLKARDYDMYLHVWEGHCLNNLEGAVYAKELRHAQEDDRITVVPWEREVPVDTYWDLGRADKTAIWFAQRVAMQVRCLGYYEASGEDITHFLRVLQAREYIYGHHHLPHDGAAKRLGSKKTIQEMIAAVYPGRVHIVPRLSVADGINAGRVLFPSVWFDEVECADGLNALRHYRYEVKDGQRSNEPVHDWASDGADAFRYMAIAMRQPKTKGQVLAGGRMAARVASAVEQGLVGVRNGWMA